MIFIFRLLLGVFVLPRAPSKMIDRESVHTYICAKRSHALVGKFRAREKKEQGDKRDLFVARGDSVKDEIVNRARTSGRSCRLSTAINLLLILLSDTNRESSLNLFPKRLKIPTRNISLFLMED